MTEMYLCPGFATWPVDRNMTEMFRHSNVNEVREKGPGHVRWSTWIRRLKTLALMRQAHTTGAELLAELNRCRGCIPPRVRHVRRPVHREPERPARAIRRRRGATEGAPRPAFACTRRRAQRTQYCPPPSARSTAPARTPIAGAKAAHGGLSAFSCGVFSVPLFPRHSVTAETYRNSQLRLRYRPALRASLTLRVRATDVNSSKTPGRPPVPHTRYTPVSTHGYA